MHKFVMISLQNSFPWSDYSITGVPCLQIQWLKTASATVSAFLFLMATISAYLENASVIHIDIDRAEINKIKKAEMPLVITRRVNDIKEKLFVKVQLIENRLVLSCLSILNKVVL